MKKQGTNMKNFKRIIAMLLVFMMSYSSVFAEFVPPAGSPVKEEVIEGTHLKYSLYVEPGEDEFIYTIYVSKAENAPENGNFSIPDDYTFYSKNLVKELYIDATDIIGLKQNPTNGRRFSPIFHLSGIFRYKTRKCYF